MVCVCAWRPKPGTAKRPKAKRHAVRGTKREKKRALNKKTKKKSTQKKRGKKNTHDRRVLRERGGKTKSKHANTAHELHVPRTAWPVCVCFVSITACPGKSRDEKTKKKHQIPPCPINKIKKTKT